MQYAVKELEIGGILDQSIRVFRDHFKFLAVLACLPFVPGMIMSILTLLAAPAAPAGTSEEIPVEAMMSSTGIILWGATLLVTALTRAVCTAAAAWGVTHRYLGNDVPAGECFRVAVRRLPRLLLGGILYSVGVGCGLLLFLIPGIYFMLSWFVMYPVMIFEDMSASRSMLRSRILMVGHKGKALVVSFILGIITIATVAFAQIIPNAYASAVLTEVISAFLMLFGAVVVTVVYVSARCRAENFDLELLTQMVEGKREIEEPAL